MVLVSRFSTRIPSVGLPSFIFEGPTAPLPSKPALIDTSAPETRFLTHATYRLWSQRLAAGLRRAGLKPGDRVLLFSGNTLFFPTVLMGVIMAGGIFTGANPTYVARELAYQLQDSGALFMIAAEGSLETALAAAKEIGMGTDRIFAFDDGVATWEGRGKDAPGGVRHWSKLLVGEEEGKKFAWDELSTKEELDRVVALNYSSGTTGVPKGVMITHRNYVSNATQWVYITKLDKDYEAKTERARLLCFLPMYHAMAQTIFCAVAPLRRVPVYLMPKFDFLNMLECVQKFRITELTLVPPIVVAMAKHPASKQFDLSSVEYVGSGAAPLGREMCVELEKLWPPGKINVKQGWGMTEVTCMITLWLPDQISESFGVGELAPNCEARIVADNGIDDVPRGERGELWVRAPNMMKGYWRKPEATAETIVDGWLRTGDVAYVDEHGIFFIVDRKKELIKVKGNQVAPAELEALLLEHPGVGDAAVIGVPWEGDEAPRAYIMKNPGSDVTAEDIIKFLNSKVTKHKRLTGGVKFVDLIPKNPSGKILRKQLRDQAKAELEGGEKAKL